VNLSQAFPIFTLDRRTLLGWTPSYILREKKSTTQIRPQKIATKMSAMSGFSFFPQCRLGSWQDVVV
jgi:hypothetical protein